MRHTKAELLAQLEELRVRCTQLEAENRSLRASAPADYVTCRRAAMAAAKEEAMRTGRVARAQF